MSSSKQAAEPPGEFYCFYEPCASLSIKFDTLAELEAHVYDPARKSQHRIVPVVRDADGRQQPPFYCQIWPCTITGQSAFQTKEELKAHYNDPMWKDGYHWTPKPKAKASKDDASQAGPSKDK